jgi:hypothetical protein
MHHDMLRSYGQLRAALGPNARIDPMRGAPLRLGGIPQSYADHVLITHKSAILSAVRVARELAPGSANLKRLVRPLEVCNEEDAFHENMIGSSERKDRDGSSFLSPFCRRVRGSRAAGVRHPDQRRPRH